jgi:hypothetical protein
MSNGRSMRIFLVFPLAVILVAQLTMAGNSDLDIHCTAKKVDESVKKASDGGASTTKEHWHYEVTVENKTFKEIDNLEVKYAIFYNQEKLGVKTGPTVQHQNGSFTIPALKPHEKKAFTTDPVELKKANLVGAWHYSSGAKPNAQDTLVGLALRISQNGQQFADYANPSTLGKEKWE